jgi:hypothetical protein
MSEHQNTNNMRLLISGDRSIADVQRDFNNAYPFLKLEFFRNGVTRQSRYHANLKIGNNTRLKDSWFLKKDSGHLDLSDSMTVLQLEESFIDMFGLSVQVFRKSGNVWLETTMTDNWTLKQQSDHAKEISRGNQKMYRPYDKDIELDRDND